MSTQTDTPAPVVTPAEASATAPRPQMTQEEKTANLGALNYIKFLASATTTDISNWDILKIFGKETGTFHLQTDKKTLNKLFTDYREANLSTVVATPPTPGQSTVETEAKPVVLESLPNFNTLTSSIKKHLQVGAKNKIKAIESDTVNTMSLIQKANLSINQWLAKIDKNRQDLATLKIPATDDSDEFKKLLSCFKNVMDKGLWENLHLVEDNNGCMIFMNTKNIVISHVDKKSNVNLTVDLGKLAVKWYLSYDTNYSHTYFKVIPYKNNLFHNNFFHPYISSNGDICWGNAAVSVSDAMKNGDHELILTLLHSLLFSYVSDSTPYIRLAELDKGVRSKKSPHIINYDFNHPEFR